MIIVRLSGGMGNQMFQYAAARALALKHNVPLKLDTTFLEHRIKMPKFLRPNFSFRNFDLDVFNIKAEIAKPNEIKFWNRPILWGKAMIVIDAALRKLSIFPGWEKEASFNNEFLNFGPNTYLQGFWQSEKYFKNISQVIKKDFTLNYDLSSKVKVLADKIEHENSLCVHLRRNHGGGSYHAKYDMDYYERGIEMIKKNNIIDKIYVFADDIDWCQKNIDFGIPTFFVTREYAGKKGEGDMFLMSKCKYFIIPNSTFSWWGAWLSERKDKIVVAPLRWTKDQKKIEASILPDDWVKIYD